MSALDDLLMQKYRESAPELPARLVTPTAEDAVDSTADPITAADDEIVASADDAAEVHEANVQLHATPQDDQDAPPLPSGNAESVDLASDVDVESDAPATDSASKTPMEEPSEASFKPEWEVDRFRWPAICATVENRLGGELSESLDRILRGCEQRNTNVVVVASECSGAGSTTMALCLARQAAQRGLSVALLDLDHQHPDLMDSLCVAFDEGIECLPERQVTAESVCVLAIEDGVSLLPATEPLSPEYCVGEEVQRLIATAASHHDLVLVDASPDVAKLISEKEAFENAGTIWVFNSADRPAGSVLQNQVGARTIGMIKNFAA